MDDAVAGAKALESKDFQGAIAHYTKALSAHPKAVDYYIKRSTAYIRLSPPNNLLSLLDAETAVVLARDRGRRELVGQAQLRRGVALYGSERYADACQCFEWAKALLPTDNSLGIWMARTEPKLKSLSEGDDRAELRVKEVPDVDIDGVLKKATVSLDPVTASSPAGKSSANGKSAATDDSKPEATPAHKIRHDWYQSPEAVTLTLLAKGVDKQRATIEIQPGSLSISFPLPTGSDYDFSIDPFFAAVDAAASTYKIMSTKIEVVLKKAQSGQKWHALEGTTPITGEVIGRSSSPKPPATLSNPTNQTGPSYPTSSKHGAKDWDKVADDLTRKPKKKEEDQEPEYDSDEGGDAVNAFFKKLYRNANPDTQRAMIKSFQESNGTALSTNWDEVSKGPVETSPPEGMEARNW